MGLKVIHPGLYTTVQDLGRQGYRAYGVPVGGAADPLALRLANLLVGNEEGAAGLEFTLAGPTLTFTEETVAALCGAPFEAMLDGQPVPFHRPFVANRGARLTIGAAMVGCRGYLAVAGGIRVPEVLGSLSTYVRGGFGGLDGRLLREGDELETGEGLNRTGRLKEIAPRYALSARSFPYGGWLKQEPATLRVIAGKEAGWFTREAMDRFHSQAYAVRAESDRMGVRLAGPGLAVQDRTLMGRMVSETVTCGAIQVPPDGQPIVLLSDSQTTGGYPRIAHVITVDIPVLAQLRPGSRVRFQTVSLEEAHRLLMERETDLQRLKTAIAGRLGHGRS